MENLQSAQVVDEQCSNDFLGLGIIRANEAHLEITDNETMEVNNEVDPIMFM